MVTNFGCTLISLGLFRSHVLHLSNSVSLPDGVALDTLMWFTCELV